MTEWTVGELIDKLSAAPKDAKIRIQDADTNWTIVKFTCGYKDDPNEFWFYPSDYGDMQK